MLYITALSLSHSLTNTHTLPLPLLYYTIHNCSLSHTHTHTLTLLPLPFPASLSPEHNNTSRRKLREHHFLSISVAVARQLTKLRLSKLYVRPHVQHVTLQPVDDASILLKLARFIPFDESSLEHDLLHNPGHSEGRDVGVVGVGLALCGNGPVLRVVEGSVSHQDHRLVGGGAVTGHGNYLLSHLVDVNLKE